MRAGLERAGLDFARPTFFSCLGVLMYLTESAIGELFGLLGGFPTGSELVFTFSPAGERTEGQRRLARRVAEVGEPLRSFFTEEDLRERLRGAGFREVTFVTPGELAERYLGDRTDGLERPRQATLGHARI